MTSGSHPGLRARGAGSGPVPGNGRNAILRYRNHPSIAVWFGRNEGVPQPILNEGLDELVSTLDGTRYYTGSSTGSTSRIAVPTATGRRSAISRQSRAASRSRSARPRSRHWSRSKPRCRRATAGRSATPSRITIGIWRKRRCGELHECAGDAVRRGRQPRGLRAQAQMMNTWTTARSSRASWRICGRRTAAGCSG